MTRDSPRHCDTRGLRRPDGRRSRSSTGTSVAVGFKIQIASRILPELHDLRRRLVLSRQVFTAARRTPREQRLSAFQRLAMEDGFTQTTLLRHSFRVSPLLFRFQHGLTPLAPAPLRRFPRVASGVHRKYPAPGGDAITLRMMAAPPVFAVYGARLRHAPVAPESRWGRILPPLPPERHHRRGHGYRRSRLVGRARDTLLPERSASVERSRLCHLRASRYGAQALRIDNSDRRPSVAAVP